MERKGIDDLSMVLGSAAALVMLYITFKFWTSSDRWEFELARYALLLCGLAVAGLIVSRAVLGRARRFDYGNAIMWTAILFGLVVISQLLIRSTLAMNNITNIERFSYYIMAGVCEEMGFRAALLAPVNRFVEKKELRLPFVVAQATLFCLAHSAVYGQDLGLMVSMFASGMIWGIHYAWREDLLANVLSHFIVNAISVGYLLVIV